MTINNDFKNAVDTKDIRLVRIMLKDSMVVDPTFREFNSLIQYAENSLGELYDPHDNETFSSDISEWNKDLLNTEMVNVVYNFSKERIEFLKQLCRHIYSDRVETKERERFVEAHKPLPKKQIGVGMMAGGAVATVAGIAISQSALTIAGVAVAAIGGVIYIQNK